MAKGTVSTSELPGLGWAGLSVVAYLKLSGVGIAGALFSALSPPSWVTLDGSLGTSRLEILIMLH